MKPANCSFLLTQDRMEEQSMTAIHVSHLHKSFEYYKKEAGLRSSLRNLIRREKLSKDAVGDISFDIEAG